MKIEYDKITDALYIYFKKAKVYKTVKAEEGVLFDVDRKGNVIGVEILDMSAQTSQKHIKGLKIPLPVYA
jgi:uncharacterized protein YuzE